MTITLESLMQRVESTLQNALPNNATRLDEAMRYSVLNGGKRLRPLLIYTIAADCGLTLNRYDKAAAAVEFIHCYSLIHDDLPAMDNDDLRRGKPTCHKQFSEALAILAGDALQSLALELIATDELLTDSERLSLLQTLTFACGMHGMVAGQAQDIENTSTTLEALEKMHQLKTGALIAATCELALHLLPKTHVALKTSVRQFANALGLAFQIQDDVLDVTSNTLTLGKPQGSDEKQNKITYVTLLGLQGAKDKAAETFTKALAALNQSGHPFPLLKQLTHRLTSRDY